jgi:vacuolar-type H+-ATPase subunit D/Vma8
MSQVLLSNKRKYKMNTNAPSDPIQNLQETVESLVEALDVTTEQVARLTEEITDLKQRVDGIENERIDDLKALENTAKITA